MPEMEARTNIGRKLRERTESELEAGELAAQRLLIKSIRQPLGTATGKKEIQRIYNSSI